MPTKTNTPLPPETEMAETKAKAKAKTKTKAKLPIAKTKAKTKPAKTKPRIEFVLQEVERLAALGITNEDMAACLGCSEATIYNRKRESEEFRAAFARGRAKAQQIAAATIQSAVASGDVRAAMFYLKARCGWKEGIEAKVESTNTTTIQQGLNIEAMSDADLASLAAKLGALPK